MCTGPELDLEQIRNRIRQATSLPSEIPQGAGESVRDLIIDALELMGEVDRLRRERDARADDHDAMMRVLYGPDLYPRLAEIVRARHGDAVPPDEVRAYHLAMAELWREGELRWFPTKPRPCPPNGIAYEM